MMLNREIYVKDPGKHQIRNNGVASVADTRTAEELDTLRFELETFVCDGEYERGMVRILQNFLDNVHGQEQPGVWVSGFFGSGKSHFVKMLRALWENTLFPEDNATARGLVQVTPEIEGLLKELDTAQKREGGIHAASGTLGSGPGDVRLALLGIVFKSANLSEQYPLARFEMWLKEQGYYASVRGAVESQGKDWHKELGNLYVSPLIADAVIKVYPNLATSNTEVREVFRNQFPKISEVSNQELVDAIRDALSVGGKFPLTLIALDEVQQYIGDDAAKSYAIQEVVETCSKRFAGKLVFVATGQTSLSGTANLQKLMGRFPVTVELSDNDVDAVIRKVILAKKADRQSAVQAMLDENLGEISRHLEGTKIAFRNEDNRFLAADYPILPARRRFWERTLRAVDQGGTSAQLRNQLKLVHEAVRLSADERLGHVVGGDFIFNEIAPSLLQTGVLPRDVYDHCRKLSNGDDTQRLQARLLSLIFLIGKLPREAGSDIGLRAKTDVLADLLIQDLKEGSAQLRRDIPAQLDALEQEGLIMRVGEEYRLQTRESSAWNDEFQAQYNRIVSTPQRLAQERIDLLRKECAERLKPIRLTQGDSKESRTLHMHFGSEPPSELNKHIYVWFRDGWEEEEKNFLADVQAAGNKGATVYVYLPRSSADELRRSLANYLAAHATLQVRGASTTHEGEEARNAMKTRETANDRQLKLVLDDAFRAARVYQSGGREIVAPTMTEAVKEAAEKSLARLYPKFNDADHTGWAKVIERARRGAEDALEAVDFQGTVDKHPVTAAVMKYVAVGKKGADIRKHFEEPEYGWPRDAIEGAIYALVATGNLRATDPSSKVLDAKNLDRAKIASVHFRLESVTVSTAQRIQIRKMITDLGLSCASGEELSAMPGLLRTLKERAEDAGGLPPSPPVPSTRLLDELSALAGNELLIAVHANREELVELSKSWIAQADAIHKRQEYWFTLNSLLSFTKEHHDVAEVKRQANAIESQRILLAEPNPLPALIDQVAQILRDALVAEHKAFQADFDAGVERLTADSSWAKLSAEARHDLRKKYQVTRVPDVQTGSVKDIMRSLHDTNLDQWSDRRAALSGRFDQVLKDAAEAVLPSPKFIKVQRATLTSNAELEAWIESVRQQVQRELESADGTPIVIS